LTGELIDLLFANSVAEFLQDKMTLSMSFYTPRMQRSYGGRPMSLMSTASGVNTEQTDLK